MARQTNKIHAKQRGLEVEIVYLLTFMVLASFRVDSASHNIRSSKVLRRPERDILLHEALCQVTSAFGRPAKAKAPAPPPTRPKGTNPTS